MPQNPFTDIWKFLTGNTNDYLALGGWRFLLVGLFYALIVLSVAPIADGDHDAEHGHRARHVALTRAGRLHVVRGHVVEAAAAGGLGAALLDGADGHARGIRVPPRVRHRLPLAQPLPVRAAGVPGGADVLDLADPWPRGQVRRHRRHLLRAAPLARH